MTELRTVQVWGVLTKLATVALGVVQTAIVLRLLGPDAYGVVGIVLSLGLLVGVTQHVGVVEAAIREIAVAETPARRAGVFWVSLWFRLAVTLPLSLALALLAPWIEATLYPLPGVSSLVRLMSLMLVLHGIQGILGGVYSGQRAFGRLYAFQLVTAAANIPLFFFLIRTHGTRGFFEAMIVAAFIFSVLLAVPLRGVLGGTLRHPSVRDMHGIFRAILGTGSWTYLARMLGVAWQRVPILLLGVWAAPATVGLFNAAVTFGSKLHLLAQAIGEVNLAFLSAAFAEGRERFRQLAMRTLRDVGAALLTGSLFLVLFASELVPLIAGPEYGAAIPLMATVTWAYAAFAFLDVATTTVFVPARRAHLRAASFLVLFGVLGVVMVGLRSAPLIAASAGLVAGGAASVLSAAIFARAREGLMLLPTALIPPLIAGVAVTFVPTLSFPLRTVLFLAIGIAVVLSAVPRARTRAALLR